ncbi:MAG: ATP-binding protein [Planctomycetes bacterium]|nr:ATP-binding protein [Planctomycetota bacterium]
MLFDELQWMAGMRTPLVSLFKSCWDSSLSKLRNLRVILCGSVSSFMVKRVLRSRALYGRVSREIDLKPLSLSEAFDFFRGTRDRREVLEIAMCLGCIPQYLKELNPKLSLVQNLNEYAFNPHGFFFGEQKRIFISHFGRNPAYERVLELLASGSKAAEALAKHCGVRTGGTFTIVLQDLELAGLIERFSPIDRARTSRDVRYRILDEYLHFHASFIGKHQQEILSGRFTARDAFRGNDYERWQGYAFERLCRRHAALIADALRFSGIQYKAGSWFVARSRQRDTARSRRRGAAVRTSLAEDRGAQIDLLFERGDRMLTVCEAKHAERLDADRLLTGLEASCRVLAERYPGYGIQTVLILGKDAPVPAKVQKRFDAVLRASEVFFR